MQYRIIKERINDQTIWALMEYDPNSDGPWVCIDDDVRRGRLERYKKNLERGTV